MIPDRSPGAAHTRCAYDGGIIPQLRNRHKSPRRRRRREALETLDALHFSWLRIAQMVKPPRRLEFGAAFFIVATCRQPVNRRGLSVPRYLWVVHGSVCRRNKNKAFSQRSSRPTAADSPCRPGPVSDGWSLAWPLILPYCLTTVVLSYCQMLCS